MGATSCYPIKYRHVNANLKLKMNETASTFFFSRRAYGYFGDVKAGSCCICISAQMSILCQREAHLGYLEIKKYFKVDD